MNVIGVCLIDLLLRIAGEVGIKRLRVDGCGGTEENDQSKACVSHKPLLAVDTSARRGRADAGGRGEVLLRAKGAGMLGRATWGIYKCDEPIRSKPVGRNIRYRLAFPKLKANVLTAP